MSVVSCKLMAAKNVLDLDEFGRATITKRYYVETNNGALDFEHTVAIETISITGSGNDPIPQLLTQYDGDHGAGAIEGTTNTCSWLLKKRITRAVEDESDRTKWFVDCTWGPLPFGYAGGTGTGLGPVLPNLDEPTADPVIERSEYEHFRRKAQFDVNGSAIANSAGDMFDDVIVDDIRPVLVFIKNMFPASDIDTMAARYKNATNTDVWRGHAIGSLKIDSIIKGPLQERRSPTTGVTKQYFPVTFKMHKAEVSYGSYGTDQNWDVVRADRGGQHLESYVSGTGTGTSTAYRKVWPKVSTGSSKGEFLDIVNLAADGTRLPDGQTPLKKTFQVYPSLPFSGLGF